MLLIIWKQFGQRLKYVADNLEAVWAEVKVGRTCTVVGSVYIPMGDIDALDTLDMVIGDILRSHEHLVPATSHGMLLMASAASLTRWYTRDRLICGC